MIEFRDCLDICGLEDMGFSGHNFTWSKKKGGVGNIQERLDRGVASIS